MKTVVKIRREDGTLEEVTWRGACIVSTEVVDDEKPQEPETFDWDWVKSHPGVWMLAEDNRGLEHARIVTLRGNPHTPLPLYVVLSKKGRNNVLPPSDYWIDRRFLPAPEKLDDLRVTFDSTDWRGLLKKAAAIIDGALYVGSQGQGEVRREIMAALGKAGA